MHAGVIPYDLIEGGKNITVQANDKVIISDRENLKRKKLNTPNKSPARRSLFQDQAVTDDTETSIPSQRMGLTEKRMMFMRTRKCLYLLP